MTRQTELRVMNCQDVWSKLYYYLAKKITDDYGIEGENCLRSGIRDFGIDRGAALRRKHLEAGLKPNLRSLFTYYDLPGDPRFRRKLIRLNEQERLSETLVCPIADVWKEYDASNLGRIYCEEFHHAMFCAYANEAQVNLSQTLTQEGDNHCRFSVYFRPANLTKDTVDDVFNESEDGFKATNYIVPSYREGYETLVIKFFYHFAVNALRVLGAEAIESVEKALGDFAKDIADQMIESAEMTATELTKEYLEVNCPISILDEVEPYNEWLAHEDPLPWEMFSRTFFTAFENRISMKNCIDA